MFFKNPPENFVLLLEHTCSEVLLLSKVKTYAFTLTRYRTSWQVFSTEFYKNFQSYFSTQHIWIAAFVSPVSSERVGALQSTEAAIHRCYTK